MFPPDQHAQVRSQLTLQLGAIVSQRLIPNASGKGRVPAVEVMFNDPGIASLVRNNEIDRILNAIADGEEDGMQTFNMALVVLVKKKIVTKEAAVWASDNPDALRMNRQKTGYMPNQIREPFIHVRINTPSVIFADS